MAAENLEIATVFTNAIHVSGKQEIRIDIQNSISAAVVAIDSIGDFTELFGEIIPAALNNTLTDSQIKRAEEIRINNREKMFDATEQTRIATVIISNATNYLRNNKNYNLSGLRDVILTTVQREFGF